METRRVWSRSAVFAALLVVLCGALYAPAVRFGFVAYDDPEYVADNRIVQAGLTGAGAKWAFTATHASNWHPLTWLSHMLDAELFGAGPAGPHAVNVLLHLANTALVFIVLRRLTGVPGRSLAVAALFALHPLRVESVAWIAERKDVLSALFFLLTLWAYANHVLETWRPRRVAFDPRGEGAAAPKKYAWYGAALALFALGLMCKPMLVTLPAVLLLLDGWPLRRTHGPGAATWRGLVREKVPFLALSMAAGVVTFLAQSGGGAVRSLATFSLGERLGNAFVAYARYLGKTFWPDDLAFFYPHPGQWPALTIAGAVLLFAAVSVAVVRGRDRFPFATTGWFWFCGMLVPVLGLVQAGAQSMADRYTYLPSIGLLVLLVWGAAEALQRWPRPLAGLAVGGAALACAVVTAGQLRHWRDSEALFRQALAATQGNFVAHNNLGGLLLDQGRVEEAIFQFRQALAFQPGYADAHGNLGRALQQQGHVADAVTHLERAVAIAPGDADAQNNLGNALLQQGDVRAAAARYEAALRLRPDHARAHNNLGWLRFQAQRSDDAIAHFETALALEPAYVTARVNLADVLAQRGDVAAAVAHYEVALKLEPTRADAVAGLARAKTTSPAVAQTR